MCFPGIIQRVEPGDSDGHDSPSSDAGQRLRLLSAWHAVRRFIIIFIINVRLIVFKCWILLNWRVRLLLRPGAARDQLQVQHQKVQILLRLQGGVVSSSQQGETPEAARNAANTPTASTNHFIFVFYLWSNRLLRSTSSPGNTSSGGRTPATHQSRCLLRLREPLKKTTVRLQEL